MQKHACMIHIIHTYDIFICSVCMQRNKPTKRQHTNQPNNRSTRQSSNRATKQSNMQLEANKHIHNLIMHIIATGIYNETWFICQNNLHTALHPCMIFLLGIISITSWVGEHINIKIETKMQYFDALCAFWISGGEWS